MSLFEETVARIGGLDRRAMKEASGALWEALPEAERLGALRKILLRFVGVTGNTEPAALRAAVIMCCADHGVSAQQVSAFVPETSVQMVRNYLLHRGAAANVFADFAQAELLVVDMGLAEAAAVPGVIDRHVARGTQDMTQGPAMTREQALQSVETGIQLALTCTADGVNCILPGDMGVANTTASTAMAAVMCGLDPDQATGIGSRISAARRRHKVEVIRRALEVNQPDAEDALDVLAKVGGFEFGCMAGLMIGAAAGHAMTMVDGINCSVAALLAVQLCPAVRDYLIPSQLSAEPAHAAVLHALGLQPLLQMDFHLGEMCGSALALDFLQAAVALYLNLTAPADEKMEPGDNTTFERMPEHAPVVTDKTFSFYLDTMPELDAKSMAACQARLDQLAKPQRSLGCLEQIAVELAGIEFEERPEKELARSLLVFTPAELSQRQVRVLDALTDYAEATTTIGLLREQQSATAGFEFGRQVAEEIGFDDAIIGLALTRDRGAELRELLLHEDGSLRYAPAEFLQQVPAELQVEVGAVIGALIAGAHNCCLMVLDDEAVEIIARYTEALCPSIRPYILHVQPAMLHTCVTLPCGIVAALGLQVVQAALCVLNDMKEFAEVNITMPRA